jgi:hypothetical protein
MTETDLLARITINPNIFGGKPIIRGRRIAVEHVLGMLRRVMLRKRSSMHIRISSSQTFKPASSLLGDWSVGSA